MVISQGSLKLVEAVRRNLTIATRSRERLPITCSSAVVLRSVVLATRPVSQSTATSQIEGNLQELAMTAPTPLSSLSSALADVVARVAPSVVSVHSHRSRSTGFVWKPGLIVTADEALADEGEVQIVLADGSTAAATIVGRDHTTDIALLRADPRIPPVKLPTPV